MNLENFTFENVTRHCGYGSRSCQSSKTLPSKFFIISHLQNFYSLKISIAHTTHVHVRSTLRQCLILLRNPTHALFSCTSATHKSAPCGQDEELTK